MKRRDVCSACDENEECIKVIHVTYKTRKENLDERKILNCVLRNYDVMVWTSLI